VAHKHRRTGRVLGNDPYDPILDGEDFRELRRRYRRFVFPVTVASLGWYLSYVLCAVSAPGVMRSRIHGEFSVAFVFGLSQFAVTFAVTYLYSRYADRRLEPIAYDIRVAISEVDR
jgi:uncharacterized membrane protein (DUF485 family)